MESTDTIGSKGVGVAVSFYILVVFMLFRPMTLVFAQYKLFGLNILEYFSVVFSYFLIVPVLFNIGKIKLDIINFSIFLFCGYVLSSILWGSQYREILRILLPFVLFFCSRILLNTSERINIMLGATLIGFIYPILGSFYSILSGTAVEKLVWRSGIEKQGGIFTRIHPFSHAMLIFIFIYSFFIHQLKKNRRYVKYGLAIMLAITIYCIYKSHVRTVYLGLLIFCFIYLWHSNKRYFYAFVLVVLCVSLFNLPQVEQIFWQSPQQEQKNLDQASSGRITTWQHNLTAYSYYNLAQKIGGIGLGGEGEKIIGGKMRVEPSHNDYLTLLMTLGPIGLFLYLLIYVALLKDIYFSNIPKNNKYWFLSVVISVLIMNFVSNGYVFRVELSQFFWLLMGIFYNQTKNINVQAAERKN